MTLGLRDLFAFIHSRAELVDPGKGNLRDGQALAAGRVDEVDITQLIAGDRRGPDVVQILFEIISASGHVKEAQAAQFLPRYGGVAGQRHFMDARAVREHSQVRVFLDPREDKIAGPVDRAVPAGAGIGKGHDPLDLRRIAADQPDAHGDRAAFAVAREVAVKGHPV